MHARFGVLAPAALVLALTTACESLAPSLSDGAVSYSPPAKFRLWWAMVESCSGQTRDYSEVSWYILPGAQVLRDGSGGNYNRATSQILFAEQALLAPPLVRHEMLHALLPIGGHPRDPFLLGCEGIVSCDGPCALDAGGRPTPSQTAPEVSPHDIGTRFEIAPAVPTESAYGGAWAIIISITNPRPYDVWVGLVSNPQFPYFTTFGVLCDTGDPAQAAGQSVGTSLSRFPLGANETRRYVWEKTASAGPLGLRAYFNVDTTPRVLLQVSK